MPKNFDYVEPLVLASKFPESPRFIFNVFSCDISGDADCFSGKELFGSGNLLNREDLPVMNNSHLEENETSPNQAEYLVDLSIPAFP